MTLTGIITMSQQQLQRLKVMEKLLINEVTQSEAAKLLGLSRRQIIRLFKKYKSCGEKGLVSKRCGILSNNRIDDEIRQKILALTGEKYADLAPTFLGEKLFENHQLSVWKETLRKWLINEGLLGAKRREKARIHQSRERRSCFAELIQIDGRRMIGLKVVVISVVCWFLLMMLQVAL